MPKNRRLVQTVTAHPDAGLAADLKAVVATYPNFPTPGIAFKDITPLVADGDRFSRALDAICGRLEAERVEFDAVVAVEARGFLLGTPIADRFRRGLLLVRKPGKLPGPVDTFGYTCEYCSGTLQIRAGAFKPNERYLIVDDLLATGGTARAVADRVAAAGATVGSYCFLVELSALGGRALLRDAPVVSLLVY
jgi:adenine phosphoribosyltransferase